MHVKMRRTMLAGAVLFAVSAGATGWVVSAEAFEWLFATGSAPAERLTEGESLGDVAIPRIGLHAVIAEGVTEDVLARSVGHVATTPLPGHPGNAALAGHRDSFFRPLRLVRVGDEVIIRTTDGTTRYLVEWVDIVPPDTLWVLEPTEDDTLTLITGFPFSFVGPAPARFVVRARAEQPSPEGVAVTDQARAHP